MRRLIKVLKGWYLVVLTGFSLVPLIWFWGRAGQIINGVDTNFPLDPLVWFTRRFYVWNPITNGGVDFSSSSAGLFFHFLQVAPYYLNLNLQLVQLFSLIFWFAAIVISSYMLACIFLKSKLGQLLFVCLYTFNIYLFNTWENVKVANLSLMVGVPLFMYFFLSLRQGKLSRLKVSYLTIILGVLVSGTGINPAYLFSLLFIVSLFVLGLVISSKNLNEVKELIKDFLLIFAVVILVNLFWILPTISFILNNISPDLSIDKIGFTNWIDSLSDNTNILNIMRLQGAWDWYAFDSVTGLPLYIPYALNYFYKLPFLFFSFLIPSLVILALVYVPKSRPQLLISFGLMFLVGIFLGAGTHLPTGSFYSYLYYRLPFFTLFRSPWYIFTPLVIVSTAGLIGIFMDVLLEKSKKTNLSWVVNFIAFLLIAGNMFYSYPLILGRIYRPGRDDGFYIQFPSYIFESKKWIDNNLEGRAVSYPPDEIEKFEWGYRGIESILSLFTNKEVLFSPLNAPNSQIANILKEFYENVLKDQQGSAFKLVSKLNIYQIFYKGDQETLSLGLPESFLELNKNSFAKWHFYDIPENERNSKFYSAEKVYLSSSNEASILTGLDNKDILINSNERALGKINNLTSDSGNIVLAENNQKKDFTNFINSPSRFSNRLLTRDLSKVTFEFEISEGGDYKPMIERFRLEEFGLNVNSTQSVELDGQSVILNVEKITDSYIYYSSINMDQGKHLMAIKLENKNLAEDGDFENQSNFAIEGHGEVRYESEGDNKYIKLVNKSSKDFFIKYRINNADHLMPYMVSTKFRQIYGNLPQILIGQSNKETLLKAQVETLPYFPDWQEASVFFEPVKTQSEINVELLAPYTRDQLGTTVVYDDLQITKVFTNDLLFMKEDNNLYNTYPVVTLLKKSPTSYLLNIKNAENEHIIIFSENYNPSWEVRMKTLGGENINVKPIHFSANLYANAWYIEDSPNEYLLEVYYGPQYLFIAGFIISASTPFVIFLFSKLVSLKLNFNREINILRDEVVKQPLINLGMLRIGKKKND